LLLKSDVNMAILDTFSDLVFVCAVFPYSIRVRTDYIQQVFVFTWTYCRRMFVDVSIENDHIIFIFCL
jgi:hypothetical protein